MRSVLRLLQGGVLITFALGAVVLAGCSATASEVGATPSAALTASPTPNGGVLACTAFHTDLANQSIRTTVLFGNDNDAGNISIDRAVVYTSDGVPACMLPNLSVLGPHQTFGLLTVRLGDCLPQNQTGPGYKFRVVVHWSRVGVKGGNLNPLDGWSEITTSDASGVVLAKIARDCKAITLPPDKCAGVTCRTENICGQQAPCEICVEGKCVVNEPHFDASCKPSCGAALSLCGGDLSCGQSGGTCVPVWDCGGVCCGP